MTLTFKLLYAWDVLNSLVLISLYNNNKYFTDCFGLPLRKTMYIYFLSTYHTNHTIMKRKRKKWIRIRKKFYNVSRHKKFRIYHISGVIWKWGVLYCAPLQSVFLLLYKATSFVTIGSSDIIGFCEVLVSGSICLVKMALSSGMPYWLGWIMNGGVSS